MKGTVLTEFTAQLREWNVPQAPQRARVLVGKLETMRIKLTQPTHVDDPAADFRRPPATPHAAELADERAKLVADVVLFGGSLVDLRVLMISRVWPPFVGHRALPGGHVDLGEDTKAAAGRELEEETGLCIAEALLNLVGVYAEPGRDPRGRIVSFAYTARLPHCPPAWAGDDAATAEWIPLSELTSTALAFDHERIIRDALKLIAPSSYDRILPRR
jgi:8-oxo-dGTP diphosphatase